MNEIKEFILKRFGGRYEVKFGYTPDKNQLVEIIIEQHSDYRHNTYNEYNLNKNGIIICSKQLYDKYYSKTQYEFFDEQILQWFMNVKGEEETFEVLDYFLQGGQ